MGEMKRAQVLRVDEISVPKLRENHETIQKLTSHLQVMQDWMNSVNDSGDFQDVESNYSGRLCHVFQSNCNDSKFSFHAQPRQKIAA